MNKVTFFRKGGKLFYMKGGKIHSYETGGPIELGSTRERMLARYQNGGIQPLDSTQLNVTDSAQQQILNQNVGNVSSPDFDSSGRKFKISKDGLTNIANTAGSVFSNINKNKYNPESQHTGNVTRGYQKTAGAIGNIKSGVTGVISGINPLIGGLINLGTGVSGAIKNKDRHGISNSEAQEVIGNMISPSEKAKESAAIGARFGGGEGLANYITFGASGRRKRLEDVERARKEDRFIENRNASFFESGRGANKNSTIYARFGKEITTPKNRLKGNWNAEIEDGEIVLGDPSQMEMGGKAKASMVSPYAAKFTGDKHGVDSDGDGQEGIPIKAQEGAYVASDYLGLNGKKAKKNEKTVAKEMEPIVKSLADADNNSTDKYKNTPQFINNQLGRLEAMKKEAEANKAKIEMKKSMGKRNTMMQIGGKIRGDQEQYATEELGVPEHIARQAQKDDPSNYNFDNAQKYKGYDVDAYKTERSLPSSGVPTSFETKELPSIVDSREGAVENIRTLGEQAGKSKFTGTSNLIQEKISEMLGKDVFSGEGKLSPQWVNKLVNEHGISREEANAATMEGITKGNVGKAFGMMLKDAYGVLGKGKDEQHRGVDPNVSGKTKRPVINNKVEWAQGVLNDIQDNDNQLPSEYSGLPEDLKDQLLDLARTGKMAHEGRFSTSLGRAFSEASTADTTEIDRQASATFADDEISAERIDKNYDLNTQGVDGKSLSFGEAFRYARENNLPTFTWKGRSFAAKTKSEAPELAAIKGNSRSKPINKTTAKTQEMTRKVNNPSRKLTKVKKGGKMSMMNKMMYRMGGKYSNIGNNMTYAQSGAMLPYKEDYSMRPSNLQMTSSRKTNPYTNDYQMGGNMLTQGSGTTLNKMRMGNTNMIRRMMQEGGMMQEEQMPNESNTHMQELMQQQMAQDPNAAGAGMEEGMMMEEGAMPPGQVPQPIMELGPELQEMFMQLPPEQQEQLLSLPPDQIEIALMNLMQQAGQQQGPAQGPPMGGPMG